MGRRGTDTNGRTPAWLADALREAVRSYYSRVRSRYVHLIGDTHTADDLSQEVFARLCQFMLRQGSCKPSWRLVEGIMKNVFREHCRHKRRDARSLEPDCEIADARTPTPPETAGKGDTLETVQELVQRLGVEEQQVIVGRHYWGMNGTELAKFLGIPRTTLTERYNHAMDTLREWLTDRGVML